MLTHLFHFIEVNQWHKSFPLDNDCVHLTSLDSRLSRTSSLFYCTSSCLLRTFSELKEGQLLPFELSM